MALAIIQGLCQSSFAAAYQGPLAIYSEVAKDFAPIAAMVMNVTGDLATIDRGRAQGITTGDIFIVYNKGIAIKDHENNGKIIGYLKQPAALLEVVHLEEQKADCHIISGKTLISPGLPATRYSDITAACVIGNSSKSTQNSCETLIQTLPNLIWLPSSSVPSEILDAKSMETLGIKILFSFEADDLKVYGPGFKLLHQYPLGKGRWETSEQKTAEKTNAVVQNVTSSNPQIHIDLANAVTVGRLPEGALQTDILDLNGDGKLEMIYLVPSGLYICPFRQQGPTASYRFYGPGRLVSFSAMPGEGWLTLNIIMDNAGMKSVLLSYKEGRLIEVQDGINLWMAFLNMGGNSKTPSMVGQSFDQDTLFGQRFYLLKPDQRGILYADTLKFPAQFSILGAYWADLSRDGEQKLIAADIFGRLSIYNSLGQSIWSTAEPVMQPIARQGILKACLVSNPNDPRLSCLLFAGRDSTDNGEAMEDRIMMLSWQDGRYVLQAISQPLGGRISGISNVNGQLLICIVRNNPKKPGNHESILYAVKVK
ncbi:hypothetical protein [Dissulfurimicrobium hydrothermale]|uniref:hypothetical protein n=1 Tax=Dissulfurimicrobium hydrothermale TaxID=1750598 RepID=UPI001EDB08EF|nr:hypothetical protein [Dissulfurimicrobium hydrothermale]UKL13028.1 hypothetical protein LGS26_05890 [Dissulfurimicrobium hydrothermale]